jgi:hypothetical protein
MTQAGERTATTVGGLWPAHETARGDIPKTGGKVVQNSTLVNCEPAGLWWRRNIPPGNELVGGSPDRDDPRSGGPSPGQRGSWLNRPDVSSSPWVKEGSNIQFGTRAGAGCPTGKSHWFGTIPKSTLRHQKSHWAWGELRMHLAAVAARGSRIWCPHRLFGTQQPVSRGSSHIGRWAENQG